LYFGGEGPFDAVQNALVVTRYGVRGRLAGQPVEIDLAGQLHLRGRHNRLNVAAAALASTACGVSHAAIPAAVSTFRGLPHRLQFVGEFAGRRFYNDSKATTPEAALAALAAFDQGEPLIVLAGGSDKGVDLSCLAAGIARRAKTAVLLGETAPELAAAIRAGGDSVRCHIPASFPKAVAWAVKQSVAGDTILLSPGCASYDWFASYEDRGDQFTSLVRR
jgi:UDP-N-acetylmuramoylalanine--D-glutamate ligase